MSILLVRVQAPAEGKVDETYLDFAHVRSNSSLLQHVQQLAWDLLPGAATIHATYTDDEGDKCTLTEQTGKDALSFVVPHKGIDDTMILNIDVRGEWETPVPVIPSIEAAAPATATAPMPTPVEEAAAKAAEEASAAAAAAAKAEEEAKAAADAEAVAKAEEEASAAAAKAEEEAKAAADAEAAAKATEEASAAAAAAAKAEEEAKAAADAEATAKAKVDRTKFDNQMEEVQNQLKELQQASFEERNARQMIEADARQMKQEAEAREHALEQSLSEETFCRTAAEETVCRLNHTLEEERHEKNQAQELAASMREEKLAALAAEADARDKENESKQHMGEQAESLQQLWEEEKRSRKEIEMMKLEADELANSLQQTLAEERKARKECEEASLAEAQSLQHLLSEEQRARKEADATTQSSQEVAECAAVRLQQSILEIDNMQQSLAAETAAKIEAVAEQRRAQDLAAACQQNLAEETDARREAERAMQDQQVLMENASKTLLTENARRLEALHGEVLIANERATKAEKVVCEMQRSSAALPKYSASVQMIEDCPLTLGIEAEEDHTACGDVTEDMAELVSSFGAMQAFRIGRIRLPASFSEVAPACARVAVKNDGATQWPQTTVIVHVEGDHFGLQVLAVGVVEPGDVKEIEMDLAVNCSRVGCSPRLAQAGAPGHAQKRVYRPRHTMPQLTPRFVAGEGRSEVRSVWAIIDAATGSRLGPLLVFEAVWDLP